MRKTRTASSATKKALAILLDASAGLHGYEISKSTGVGAGTLYPMLARLEDRELLASEWEANAKPGRPPRRIYRLTEAGREYAKSVLSEGERSSSLGGRPA